MIPASNRRGFLRGLTTLPLIGGSVAATHASADPALHVNDLHLIAVADTLEALQRACDAHTAEHPSGNRNQDDEDDFDALVDGFWHLEDEIAETPADTMMGVLSKARACQIQTLRDFPAGVVLSLADDVVRLHAAGVPLVGGRSHA